MTGPYGSDGVRVVVGLLTFFAFLDLLVALLGRYDMILGALVTAWLAQRLYTRRASVGFEPDEHPTAPSYSAADDRELTSSLDYLSPAAYEATRRHHDLPTSRAA
ncbi:hypothetical protein [Krasilnikovia sp. M28-CT-15]|uniref:hypothetical protein n=1 Tax=Krasilnikovia sp. M28-CT-15 TaxID=3373540 RepID=UPI003876277D